MIQAFSFPGVCAHIYWSTTPGTKLQGSEGLCLMSTLPQFKMWPEKCLAVSNLLELLRGFMFVWQSIRALLWKWHVKALLQVIQICARHLNFCCLHIRTSSRKSTMCLARSNFTTNSETPCSNSVEPRYCILSLDLDLLKPALRL